MMMEFPALFEEPPVSEATPDTARKPEETAPPTTALAVFSRPALPVLEIIQDAGVLRNVLDKLTRHPISMIGEELLSGGFITPAQLEQAIRIQAGSKLRIGEILVSTGAVDQDTIDFILARRLGVPSVDLRKLEIAPEAISLVPKLLASMHTLMPCLIHRNHLVVAMENPMDQNALKALRFACGKHVLAVLAPREDIEWAIGQRYKELRKDQSPLDHWI